MAEVKPGAFYLLTTEDRENTEDSVELCRWRQCLGAVRRKTSNR